jgi:hypothetical protein
VLAVLADGLGDRGIGGVVAGCDIPLSLSFSILRFFELRPRRAAGLGA